MLLVIVVSNAGNGDGADVRRIRADCAQILDGEDVVGLRQRFQHIFRRADFCKRIISGARIGFAKAEMPVQRTAVGRGLGY